MDKGKAAELLEVTILNFGGNYLKLRLHNKFERELTCRSLFHYSPLWRRREVGVNLEAKKQAQTPMGSPDVMYRPFRNSCPRALFCEKNEINRINAKILVLPSATHSRP